MNAIINYQPFSKFADVAANALDELPREVANRITGDKLRIVHSVADNFDSLKIEFTLPPHAAGAPLHYHLGFVEKFAVTDGKLEMRIGSKDRIVAPGETVAIPIGVLHGFSNPHSETVTFTTEIAPAVEFEKFIRSMYGLANDGKTNKDGMPKNLLHLALILDYADLYFPYLPATLQTLTRKLLTGLARKIGAENDLRKYHETRSR